MKKLVWTTRGRLPMEWELLPLLSTRVGRSEPGVQPARRVARQTQLYKLVVHQVQVPQLKENGHHQMSMNFHGKLATGFLKINIDDPSNFQIALKDSWKMSRGSFSPTRRVMPPGCMQHRGGMLTDADRTSQSVLPQSI